MAWTHGLLPVRRHGFEFDWIMYGLKCLIAAAMPNASISHGSHVTWCFFSLALKKPTRRVCPFRETFSVDPIPCWMTEPSVTIHNWSLGCGNVIDLLVENVFWAHLFLRTSRDDFRQYAYVYKILEATLRVKFWGMCAQYQS